MEQEDYRKTGDFQSPVVYMRRRGRPKGVLSPDMPVFLRDARVHHLGDRTLTKDIKQLRCCQRVNIKNQNK